MPGKTLQFDATIHLIGINPYVLLPEDCLSKLFERAGKSKGMIPVRLTIDELVFTQTLVKYAGQWRAYLNRPMRDAAGKEVGDRARFEVSYDAVPRGLPMHEGLQRALSMRGRAAKVFEGLPPSLQQEIIRYISRLTTDIAVEQNIKRAVRFLLGKEHFIGREPIRPFNEDPKK